MYLASELKFLKRSYSHSRVCNTFGILIFIGFSGKVFFLFGTLDSPIDPNHLANKHRLIETYRSNTASSDKVAVLRLTVLCTFCSLPAATKKMSLH